LRTATDWGQPCPNPTCSHYSLMNRGNVRAIATYPTQSGRRRIFQCKLCGEQFSETRGTVFFDLRTVEETVILVLKLLLCKVELTALSFALGVTEGTVLEWLRRAAEKAEEINQHLLREVNVTQVQLDELWNFIARKQATAAAPDGESPDESADGRQWVWVSFAPEFRLLLATYVGPRTFQSALHLIQMTAAVVRGVPCFFSDGLSSYWPALVAVYHQIKEFARTGKRGRPRKPVLEPHPELVYAQLVKKKKRGRLHSLNECICWGAARLAALGHKVSTSLIERLNLTLRHALAPLTRKCWGFCKDRQQLRRRVVFFQTFYNFARPHQSLRSPLLAREQPGVRLICPKWQPRTPAMAAGLTNHVWTFRELLTAKFEPILNQSISG
jgi:transposase-like protein